MANSRQKALGFPKHGLPARGNPRAFPPLERAPRRKPGTKFAESPNKENPVSGKTRPGEVFPRGAPLRGSRIMAVNSWEVAPKVFMAKFPFPLTGKGLRKPGKLKAWKKTSSLCFALVVLS